MPTYDYVCKECGHRFEAFQSMKDPVLRDCPECEQEALQRLIGAGAGLLFKGSGYYLTDYKKSSSSQATSSGESSGESSTSEATGSANGSPADKTPASSSGTPADKTSP